MVLYHIIPAKDLENIKKRLGVMKHVGEIRLEMELLSFCKNLQLKYPAKGLGTLVEEIIEKDEV